MKHRLLLIPLLLSLFLMPGLLLTPGCDRAESSGLPVTSMQIGPERFSLEIATSFHDQEVGLMHRDSLAPDHGMIFPFPKAAVQNFWNHDVHFPLDLIFLDGSGAIVSFQHMDAYSDKAVSSGEPAQFVIELLGGTLSRLNLKQGDKLVVPKDAADAAEVQPSSQPATAP